jgi:hypothetical protein
MAAAHAIEAALAVIPCRHYSLLLHCIYLQHSPQARLSEQQRFCTPQLVPQLTQWICADNGGLLACSNSGVAAGNADLPRQPAWALQQDWQSRAPAAGCSGGREAHFCLVSGSISNYSRAAALIQKWTVRFIVIFRSERAVPVCRCQPSTRQWPKGGLSSVCGATSVVLASLWHGVWTCCC